MKCIVCQTKNRKPKDNRKQSVFPLFIMKNEFRSIVIENNKYEVNPRMPVVKKISRKLLWLLINSLKSLIKIQSD